MLSPAQAGWQIDLNSPLRNSDQIDSVSPASSVRGKKALLGVAVNNDLAFEMNPYMSARKYLQIP